MQLVLPRRGGQTKTNQPSRKPVRPDQSYPIRRANGERPDIQVDRHRGSRTMTVGFHNPNITDGDSKIARWPDLRCRGRLPRRPRLLAPGGPIQRRLAQPERARRDLDGLVDTEELERLVQ